MGFRRPPRHLVHRSTARKVCRRTHRVGVQRIGVSAALHAMDQHAPAPRHVANDPAGRPTLAPPQDRRTAEQGRATDQHLAPRGLYRQQNCAPQPQSPGKRDVIKASNSNWCCLGLTCQRRGWVITVYSGGTQLCGESLPVGSKSAGVACAIRGTQLCGESLPVGSKSAGVACAINCARAIQMCQFAQVCSCRVLDGLRLFKTLRK